MNLFLARLKDFFKSVAKFFAKDLWNLDFSELSKFKMHIIKGLQAIILTGKGFTSERIGREAIALSRFTTLAVVPMLAVIIFITHGFRLDMKLAEMLYSSFPDSTELIHVILEWAMNIIKATESGTFGWISFLFFVWTIVWLMINIELAFNRVWGIKNTRSLWHRAAIYVGIMITAPFVLVLFLTGWVWYARFIGILEGKLGAFSFITTNLFWVAFYGVAALALSMMYKLIPQTKVRYGAALKAALISGIAFVVVQYLYMGTQLMVTRLNMVYGALAFIPLFMIWMNICWQIILFGAELSRGYTIVDYREAMERGLLKES